MALAHPSRASLIATLAARRLDRTLTATLPVPAPDDESALGRTGLGGLDAQIGGGVPRGHLSEIVGPRSSGATSVLLHLMAAATARGELVALVDALDRLDVASAASAGIDLNRLLWIRGHVVTSPGSCHDANQRALEQVVRALTLVLQAGNFGLVVLDVSEAAPASLRRLPHTTWLRLQRMVEGSQTMAVIVANEPVSRSAGGVTVRTGTDQDAGRRGQGAGLRAQGPGSREQGAGRFSERLFEGLAIRTRVVRARAQDDTAVSFMAGAPRV